MNHLESYELTNKLALTPINFEQATILIIERAKELVNRLIEQRGHSNPPFLPEEFAHLLGVKRIMRADLGKLSAIMLRFHDGHLIKVNKNHSPVRQNFSCAHEMGHTLFSELKLGHYLEHIEYRRTYNPQATERLRSRAKERLCDVAATELLMPELIFSKYLSGFSVSVSSIELLANIFRVSVQAAARRVAEVSTEPCIVLLWHLQQKTRSKIISLAWHVGPGRKPQDKSCYTPQYTRIKYPSTLHEAYHCNSIVKCHRLFKVDNTVKRLPMETKAFGYGETRYVISLAFPER